MHETTLWNMKTMECQGVDGLTGHGGEVSHKQRCNPSPEVEVTPLELLRNELFFEYAN